MLALPEQRTVSTEHGAGCHDISGSRRRGDEEVFVLTAPFIEQGAAGEVKRLHETGCLTSPAAPISLGSVTLFDRRGIPSSKEGIGRRFSFG